MADLKTRNSELDRKIENLEGLNSLNSQNSEEQFKNLLELNKTQELEIKSKLSELKSKDEEINKYI